MPNYNQYLSVNHIGGYVYSKEVHTLNREIEIKRVKKFNWKFFIQDQLGEGKYQDVKGHPLKLISSATIKDFKDKVKAFNDYGHKVYGTDKLAYQYIYENFEKDKINNKFVRIGYFDIETSRDPIHGYSPAHEAKNPITTISLVLNGKNYYWARKDLPSSFLDKFNVEFFWFDNEAEMLDNFNRFVGLNVDILSGWNIETYDITYLVTRSLNLGVDPKKLSPFNMITKKEIKDGFYNTHTTYNIIGVAILDYLQLYKKFTYVTRDNYRLDTIAEVELGDKKVDYAAYGNLENLYHENFELFSEYNIKDSQIVSRLENKLRLIDLAITLAYKTGCNFEDTLGTVKIWTVYLYQEMMDKNIVPHMFPEAMPEKEIVGGYVKDPIRGKHEWVMSFDLASLYPHNQMGMNISFDKILDDEELPADILQLKADILNNCNSVEQHIENIVSKEYDLSILKQYNIGMTPNIQFYKNDGLGIIPSILKGVYNERKAVKVEMLKRKQEKIDTGNNALDNEIARLNAIQLALKVLMNSQYGALANPWFLYFDTRNAEAITSVGQTAIKFIGNKLNEFMNKIMQTTGIDYIIATDTDSVYINFGGLVKKYFPDKTKEETTNMLDKMANEKIQPFINKSYHELKDYLNGFNMEWFMKREAIASSAVFVQKKRYFMHILDDEGVRMKVPKLKVTGLEAVRSSTPDICRKALKAIMGTILEKNEEAVQKEVERFKKEFYKADPIDISIPKSVNDIEKWISNNNTSWKTGTPFGVRSAIIFNALMSKVDPLYETIKSGDKVKICYLKLPNKFKSNAIAFPNEIPKKLGLDNVMIDRETQFGKTYLNALDAILGVIGWSSAKKNKLSGFFG